jgi:hypothetical protein
MKKLVPLGFVLILAIFLSVNIAIAQVLPPGKSGNDCLICGSGLPTYNLSQRLGLSPVSQTGVSSVVMASLGPICPPINWTTLLLLALFASFLLIALYRYVAFRSDIQKKRSAMRLMLWAIFFLIIILAIVGVVYYLGIQSCFIL